MKIHKIILFWGMFFLSSCSFGDKEVSLLHLKIGSNIVEFDKMQPDDWSVAPKKLAYLGNINIDSPVKIELGRGVTLDIPYAKTMLLIENSRLQIISLVTNPYRKPQKIKEAKALYQTLYQVLEQHPDWYFNKKLTFWMKVKNTTNRTASEEVIELRLQKYGIYFTSKINNKLIDCLSGLHDHLGLFDKEKINLEPNLDRRIASLSGIDIDAVKLALKILGRKDPRKLPLEEYVSRVNQYMSIRCPDMLEQYGK